MENTVFAAASGVTHTPVLRTAAWSLYARNRLSVSLSLSSVSLFVMTHPSSSSIGKPPNSSQTIALAGAGGGDSTPKDEATPKQELPLSDSYQV